MSLKRNTIYVSEIDKFLERFNRTHTPSKSQMIEIEKYQRLNKSRDHVQPEVPNNNNHWEEF